MALNFLSRASTPGDGTTTAFSIPFPYIIQSQVLVYVRPTVEEDGVLQIAGVDYIWTSAGLISFLSAPPVGSVVDRIRSSGIASVIARLLAPSTLSSAQLNAIDTQLFYIIQEISDSLTDLSARAITAPPGEILTGTLPAAAARAGKFLSFDSLGNPLVASGTGADGPLRSDLAGSGGYLLVALSGAQVAASIGTLGGDLQSVLNGLQTRQPVNTYNIAMGMADQAMGNIEFHFSDPLNKALRPVYGGGANQQGLVIPPSDTGGIPALWVRETQVNNYYTLWKHTKDATWRQKLLDEYSYLTTTLYTEPGILTGGNGHYVPTNTETTLVSTFDDGCFLAQYHEQAARCGNTSALLLCVDTITTCLDKFLPATDPTNPTTVLIAHAPNYTNVDEGLGSYVDAGGHTRNYGKPVVTSQYGSRYTLPSESDYTNGYGEQSSSYEGYMALSALYCFEKLGLGFLRTYAINTYNFMRSCLLTPDPLAVPNDVVHSPVDPTQRKAQYLIECGFRLNVTVLSNDPYQKPLRPDKQWYGRPKRNQDSTDLGGCLVFCVLAARLYKMTGNDQYRQDAINTSLGMVSLQGYGRVVGGKTIIMQCRDPHSDGHHAYTYVDEVLTLPGMPNSVRQVFIDSGAYIAANCVNLTTGYITADWGGREYDGTYNLWEDAYAVNGDYAGAAQQMVSNESFSMLFACAVQAERQAGIPGTAQTVGLDVSLSEVTLSGTTQTLAQWLSNTVTPA